MKSNKLKMYRQGDVAIERVSSLPSGLKPIPLESGKVILAYGEVTGHHHAFAAEDCEKYIDDNGGEFFKVNGRDFNNIKLPILRRWNSQVMVDHPEYGIIEFAVVDVLVEGNSVTIPGRVGLLVHDEHTAHGIAAGVYKGAGATGTVRQREYSPEAIRNVAD